MVGAMSDLTTDRVFDIAADLFSMLSAPTRLRIVCALREGEKNVGELQGLVGVSQQNISQHLGMLFRGGVVCRRRLGPRVYYRVESERVLLLCDAVCMEQAHAPGGQRSKRVGLQ